MPARRPAASFFCPTHPPVKPNAAYLVLIMVPYVLPLAMVEVREYLDRSGRSPFAVWSDRLNREAAGKVAAALARIQQGNFSNAKGVGAGGSSIGSILVPGTRFTSGRVAAAS